MKSTKILCVSFSPIHADARVLRQLDVLREQGEVTTVGYGPAPEGVTRHIQVPDSAASLPQTPLGVAKLALRQHRAVELQSPGERAVKRETIESGPYDLVVANDARALPLAFAAAGNAPVYADMHEWAPEEMSTILSWRLLVGPYMHHLCARYLPQVSAVTTVSAGLAELYADRYGPETGVIKNAPDYQDLSPAPVGDVMRLVHSGTADLERNLPTLIDAVSDLGDRFTLDLYLIRVPGGHLDEIAKKVAKTPRITLHDPVPPDTLPTVLNQYDIGVFLYPIKSLTHLYHLPNKFFDFVQARLGLVFGPAPETDKYITDYGLGVITSDVSVDALVTALRSLTVEQVSIFKRAADHAAHQLSSAIDKKKQSALVAGLLAER